MEAQLLDTLMVPKRCPLTGASFFSETILLSYRLRLE